VDTALVQHLLPLLVAAISGYAAHRLARRVREAVDVVRARSVESPRPASDAGEAPARRPVRISR
jgi:hypothetical protein